MAPRRKKQPSASASWPLCSETTALCLSFLSTTADVLNCDRVCRSFRACKAALPSEVLLKGNASRTAWLQANVGRVSKLQLVISSEKITKTTSSIEITAQEYAGEVCSALVGARLQQLDIISVPLPYVSTGNYSLSLPDDVFQLATLQHLGFSNMSVRALPNQLVLLTGLTSLSIDKCNKLVSLPEALGQLSRLQGITISNSGLLASLPSSIGTLSNLQCLSISECSSLASLPESIGQLTSLQLLSVGNVCRMPSLPESISCLTQLRTLKATGIGLLTPAIPVGACGKMTSLTRLEMTWRTDSLPDAIGDLSKLEVLVATCATLTALPSTVAFLSSLRVLRLRDCRALQQLPEALGDLSSLQELELFCSKLTHLPDSFGNLTSLERLSIANFSRNVLGKTSLDGVPFTALVHLRQMEITGCTAPTINLSGLASLERLAISTCNLRHIVGVEQLTSMQKVTVSECRTLRPLPSGCWEQLACLQEIDMFDVGSLAACLHSNCLSNLTGLHHIRIAYAGLTQLPPSLESLSALQRLHLSDSGLTALPTGLGKLSSLTELSLRDSRKLSELPASWGNLQSLQSCTIGFCKALLALPASTSRLTALTSLYVAGLHNLAALPASIGSLGKLQTLSIIGCPVLALLPNRLQRLTSLNNLSIWSCDALESLPSGLGRLSSLQRLSVQSCPSLTSIEGTWEDATSLNKVSIDTCLKLGTLPDRLRQMSGHLFSAAYKGPTGRMYPTNLALAAGDLRLGSPEYAAAEEEQQDDDDDDDDGDNPFLVDAVLDEVEVGVTRKRSQEVVQVVKVLVKWKGFELDVGVWEPLSGVQHTTAWKKWAKMKRKPAWFRAVKPEAAAEAFKAAMN